MGVCVYMHVGKRGIVCFVCVSVKTAYTVCLDSVCVILFVVINGIHRVSAILSRVL